MRTFNTFNGTSYSDYSNVATATTQSQLPTLDFSAGFANSGGTLNYVGSAKIASSSAQLTDMGTGENGSVWSKAQQDIRKFNVIFTFTQTNGTADGMTFTIQPRVKHGRRMERRWAWLPNHRNQCRRQVRPLSKHQRHGSVSKRRRPWHRWLTQHAAKR